MTNKNKPNSSLFPKKPPTQQEAISKPVEAEHVKPTVQNPNHRYQSGCKHHPSPRGMSRSPLAREVLREKINQSPYFGKCHISSRGVTQAYDQCPIDGNLRSFAKKVGYVLQGYSRFSTLPDLAQADLIIPLDHESDDFTKVHRNAIRGDVKPFGIFLPAGSSPYLGDPYDRDENLDPEETYNEICIPFDLVVLKS